MKNLPVWRTAEAYPRKNVMTALLWLSALTFPLGAGSLMMKPWPGILVFAVGVICIFMTIFYYWYWAKFDADRLQTEDYRIQREYVNRLPDSIALSSEHFAPRDGKLVLKVGGEGGND